MSQKIKALLIDDEISSVESMISIMSLHCPNVEVIGKAHSAIEALKLIRDTDPDIVFLDINLGNESGFDVLELVEKITFQTIFVTAHQKYAVEAIRKKVFDYLLKPIDVKQLTTTIDRVCQNIQNKPNHAVERLSIHTSEGIEFIYIQEIIYAEADGNYVMIYLTTGKHIVASKTLKYFEEMLPKKLFFRPHQSFIINLKEVRRLIKTDGLQIEMSNGKCIPVSRSNRTTLMELLK